jgi:hypothetical protein
MKRGKQFELKALALDNTPILQYSKTLALFAYNAI